jgi:dTDP-4-amino-4,6-dideoxygalactose transaminase
MLPPIRTQTPKEPKLERIPLLDTQPELQSIWPELTAKIEEVLKKGAFIMGPNVKAFETEAAQYLGVKHAVALNSGTDALILGCAALGIGPGDEVITTPFTFFATSEAVSHFRAVPVFVDIDPRTYNFNTQALEAAITPRTKAIIPVHIFGQAADMDTVMALARKYNLKVLEDVAQAFGGDYKGTKLGAIGHAGAFSFFPSKNLGAIGDGGLFVTNDDALADTVRMLRVHGARKKYYNEVVGVNSRLDEIQAGILRVKLPHIDEWNEGRRRAAMRYNQLLADLPGITPPFDAEYGRHVYHQYTIRLSGYDRDAVMARLNELGVGTMVYYPVPLHKLPVYKEMNLTLPMAEEAAANVFSLPMWPKITEEVQIRVVQALRQAL